MDRHAETPSFDGRAEPSITCLMVTLPVFERLSSAKQSIEDFCRQTWSNKELIVVINGGTEPVAEALCAHIAALERRDIHVVVPAGTLNLGRLRNISLEAASGILVCQWDDDDRYHPQRLERQASLLIDQAFDAVYLQETMQFFPDRGTMFWVNWRATPIGGHPGTLMVRRCDAPRYPTEGDLARLGEDSEVARDLIARGRVGFLPGAAYLYVYVSHGSNSWNDAHHTMLCQELAISRGLLQRRERDIREGLRPLHFPENAVTISGNNGAAFVL